MKWKSIIAGMIVFGATISVGQADEQATKVPASLLDRTEVRFYGESGLVTKSLEHAIKDGSIVTQTYTVRPKDTLWEILGNQGLRADPGSVEVINALNSYNLVPNILMPGQKLKILSKGDTEQAPAYKSWALVVDAEKKALLDEEYQKLRGAKVDMAIWAASSDASSYKGKVYKGYQQVLDEMGDLRLTWYAVDPATLRGTHDAIASVNQMVGLAKAGGMADRQLKGKFVKTLAVITDDVSMQVQYARNYDQALVSVEVVTRKATRNEEVMKLSVCYRSAMEYRLYRLANPGKEPDWDCLYSFNTLSSPAESTFQHNTAFAIWAEQGGKAVSDYHIVDIRPNQDDGRCRFELAIDG